MPPVGKRYVTHEMNAYARGFLSMALGALAAPAMYLLAGVIVPAGFHDLGNASIMLLLISFASAWFFSTMATFCFGIPLWPVLHRFNLDGFLSYSVIAVVGALAIHFGIGADGHPIFGMVMALSNAILVRAVELMFRARAAK